MTEPILGKFSLSDEIERLTPGDNRSGRRAEILVKTDRLRVVLTTMRAGIELQEHTAPGPITIHALEGSFTVTVEGDDHDLDPGDLISIQPNAPHSVRATTDGAFLLTISWTPNDTSDPETVSQR